MRKKKYVWEFQFTSDRDGKVHALVFESTDARTALKQAEQTLNEQAEEDRVKFREDETETFSLGMMFRQDFVKKHGK